MTLQGCREGEMRVFKPWHLVSWVSVVSMLLEKKIHRNGKNITVRCGTGIHFKYDELTTSLHIHGNKSHMAQGYSVCLLLTLFLVSEPLLPRDETFSSCLTGHVSGSPLFHTCALIISTPKIFYAAPLAWEPVLQKT